MSRNFFGRSFRIFTIFVVFALEKLPKFYVWVCDSEPGENESHYRPHAYPRSWRIASNFFVIYYHLFLLRYGPAYAIMLALNREALAMILNLLWVLGLVSFFAIVGGVVLADYFDENNAEYRRTKRKLKHDRRMRKLYSENL